MEKMKETGALITRFVADCSMFYVALFVAVPSHSNDRDFLCGLPVDCSVEIQHAVATNRICIERIVV